jgi:cytochrome c-type biogenesis protein CcmH
MRFLILLLLVALPAFAFEYEAPLANAEQEKTAQEIFTQVRCLVCDGESLAASNADVSVDMRALVREQIASGKSENEVLSYLVERYGAAILQAPPKQGGAILLWLMPLLLLGVGLVVILKRGKK